MGGDVALIIIVGAIVLLVVALLVVVAFEVVGEHSENVEHRAHHGGPSA